MIAKIMCVDDDPMTLMLNKLTLKKCNFCQDALTAENGKIAIEYFEQQLNLPLEKRELPDLIFLDLNMPEMNGWEFLNAYLKEYMAVQPELKVVILSSTVDPDDRERAIKNPLVIDFISKPLTIRRLDELKKHQALSQYFLD